MSFVFTVSSFCTSAPEEREEKPRNRAFGYVAKSDALQGEGKDDFLPPFLRERSLLPRTPKKSTWGFSERDDTRLRAQMRAEASRRGRGVEKRAEAKQRGPREGAGALQAKSKDRKQSDARGRLVQGRAKLRPATPPQRHLRDSRRPTCTRAAANLGVPLPQQVRCRGAHRATNARLAERAQA